MYICDTLQQYTVIAPTPKKNMLVSGPRHGTERNGVKNTVMPPPQQNDNTTK
jgi:hypothetical protein